MLIRFAVENCLSIRERQELSLVASSLKDRQADLIRVLNFGFELLPAAVIYGANASGKSNVVAALNFVQNVVANSHTRGGPDTGVSRTPFLLHEKAAQKPSRFEIEFLLHGIRMCYGFAATDTAFVEEFLYAFPSGKQQTWYFRKADKNTSISERI
jgi:AAA15 family ATPase/GTPase